MQSDEFNLLLSNYYLKKGNLKLIGICEVQKFLMIKNARQKFPF